MGDVSHTPSYKLFFNEIFETPDTVGSLISTYYDYNQQLFVFVVSFIDGSTAYINPSNVNL